MRNIKEASHSCDLSHFYCIAFGKLRSCFCKLAIRMTNRPWLTSLLFISPSYPSFHHFHPSTLCVLSPSILWSARTSLVFIGFGLLDTELWVGLWMDVVIGPSLRILLYIKMHFLFVNSTFQNFIELHQFKRPPVIDWGVGTFQNLSFFFLKYA